MSTRTMKAARSSPVWGAAGFLAAVLLLPVQDRFPIWAFMWALAFAIFAACNG